MRCRTLGAPTWVKRVGWVRCQIYKPAHPDICPHLQGQELDWPQLSAQPLQGCAGFCPFCLPSSGPECPSAHHRAAFASAPAPASEDARFPHTSTHVSCTASTRQLCCHSVQCASKSAASQTATSPAAQLCPCRHTRASLPAHATRAPSHGRGPALNSSQALLQR